MNSINNVREEKKSRQRGDNWTQEEKDLFLEIMQQSAPIIENKHTDTDTNKTKYLEWLKVQTKLKELTGKHRDIVQLKGFWRRSKLHAKKNVSLYKSALLASGGGPQPAPPSQEDLKIINMCTMDFDIEPNTYDSDGVYIDINIDDCAKVTQEKYNSTIYNIESNEMHIHKETNKQNRSEQSDFNEKINMHPARRKYRKTQNSQKGMIISTNNDLKKRIRELIEEEYALKVKYHKQELSHQELRHKLEYDILLLEKEKKELEILKLKSS